MPTIIISTLTITETICPAALQEADFSSPDVRGAYNRLIRINIILAYCAEMEQTGSPYGLTNADRHRCVMPPPHMVGTQQCAVLLWIVRLFYHGMVATSN